MKAASLALPRKAFEYTDSSVKHGRTLFIRTLLPADPSLFLFCAEEETRNEPQTNGANLDRLFFDQWIVVNAKDVKAIYHALDHGENDSSIRGWANDVSITNKYMYFLVRLAIGRTCAIRLNSTVP